MGSRLRDYIKVYDDVIDPANCQNLIDYWQISDEKSKLMKVEVENFANYYMTGITAQAVAGDAAAMRLHKYLSRMAIHYWGIYQKDLGIEEQGRFHPDYDSDSTRAFTESFFMRSYLDDSFYTPSYDARCAQSGRRFASFVLFLTEDEIGRDTFHFEQDVVAPTIHAKPGRLMIFPSSWQYAHKEMGAIEGDPRFTIYGYYSWYDPNNIKQSIDKAKADGVHKS